MIGLSRDDRESTTHLADAVRGHSSSSDSPISKRPPGLVGMASWQVADLDAAVKQASAAGFIVADPEAGPLPGTRIATVQGADLAVVNMQLL